MEETTTAIEEIVTDEAQIDESEVNEAESTPEAEEEAHEEGEQAKAPQSRADNAKFAEKRRQAERQKAEQEAREREKQEAYQKGKIEGIGGKNPYTEEPIENAYDLHLYELMKGLDDSGKDPIKGLAGALSRERAEKEAQESERIKAEQEQAKLAEDNKAKATEAANKLIAELGKKYPEADFAWFKKAYSEDAKFKDRLKHGYTPVEAYEELYLPNQGEPQFKHTSTPSNMSGGARKEKSVMDMSDEEFLAYQRKRRGEDW